MGVCVWRMRACSATYGNNLRVFPHLMGRGRAYMHTKTTTVYLYNFGTRGHRPVLYISYDTCAKNLAEL